MPTTADTNSRIRGLFGTGFVAWILLTVSLFAPEWTRQQAKHCGVIFCCQTLYGNCTITDTEVVGDKMSWILASWLCCFVAICSSTCRCTEVKVENVRQMAVFLVLSGVLALTGSTEFFVQKFTDDELNFSGCGFVAHAAGWMLFIAGCCGFCHGYEYDEDEAPFSSSVYPLDRMGSFGFDRFTRYGPMNYARKKWADIQHGKTQPSVH